MTKKLITEDELSEMLSISVSTLQKKRCYGEWIPFVKFGRAVRYDMEAVEKFLKENTFNHTSHWSYCKEFDVTADGVNGKKPR